jgi:hypothetical protein
LYFDDQGEDRDRCHHRCDAGADRLEVGFTMGVRMQKSVVSAISSIAESA